MGPSRGFEERLESVKAGATATASGAVAMVPISALDENSGGDPLVICYIAMVAMVAMALIESSMIFPANRWNLHLFLGFSMAMLVITRWYPLEVCAVANWESTILWHANHVNHVNQLIMLIMLIAR